MECHLLKGTLILRRISWQQCRTSSPKINNHRINVTLFVAVISTMEEKVTVKVTVRVIVMMIKPNMMIGLMVKWFKVNTR